MGAVATTEGMVEWRIRGDCEIEDEESLRHGREVKGKRKSERKAEKVDEGGVIRECSD